MKNSKIAVLIDFDGTVTLENVMNSLYVQFGGPAHRQYIDAWDRGEIGTIEEIERIFETANATRLEMEAYLHTFELDPGFKPLVEFCRQRGYPLAIVSDGFVWYIDYILGNNQVQGVRVYGCEIHFDQGGFRFEYPWYDPAYPLRSTAKPLIVSDYQRRGYQVVFVGDGLSDVEAAEQADIVYAKDVLFEQAGKRGIVVREFGNLLDVVRTL